MKKKFSKVTICSFCLIFAGIGSRITYNSYITSQARGSLLIKENVEAVSQSSNPEGRRFIAIKCFLSEANQGTSGYICPEGTGIEVFTDCPNVTKTGEGYPSGHCLRELQQ